MAPSEPMDPSHDLLAHDAALSKPQRTPLCYIVTPCGMLGYGFDQDLADAEIAQLRASNPLVPVAIILDSGSTDSGPSKLALGTMTCPRESYKRDLTKLLALVKQHEVPVLFSSAGGDGSNDHVDEMLQILEEVLETQHIR